MSLAEFMEIADALDIQQVPQPFSHPKPHLSLSENTKIPSKAPLILLGFEHGLNLRFLAEMSLLEESGLPHYLFEQFTDKPIPIKLDAAYHTYNQMEYDEEHLHLTLSFDAVYRVAFPWGAIQQVIFTFEKSDPTSTPDGSTPAPHLKLVD